MIANCAFAMAHSRGGILHSFCARFNTRKRSFSALDGLKGFPEAITAVFPQTQVQTCIVHLIRNSLDFVSYKDRKAVAAALKQIYRAKDAAAGQEELNTFAEGPWGRKYPAIAQSWRRHWSEVIPFFAFPDEVRRIIYTTNAIEFIERQIAPSSSRPRPFPHRREDAGHFVGQRHGGQLRRFAFEEVDDPGRPTPTASNMLDDGGGANHQHAAQGLVASPSDFAPGSTREKELQRALVGGEMAAGANCSAQFGVQ